MADINLRAAPILNEDKEKYFKYQYIRTILGGFIFSNQDLGIEITY
jgi:hypothetical protein